MFEARILTADDKGELKSGVTSKAELAKSRQALPLSADYLQYKALETSQAVSRWA